MKAAQISRYSKKLEVEINSIDIPAITSTQVLIKTKAAGVDPHLVLAITGKVKLFDHYNFPLTLGNEFAGVVVEVGSGVQNFKTGDFVYAMPPLDTMGAFAEYVAVEAAIVAKMPANHSFIEAAAIPLSALTIIQALDILGAQQGSKLFISGGTGGFGQVAIPYAKSQGLFVTVSGSGSARDLANRLGADEFIDYETQDYTRILKGFDYVIDTRGASEISKQIKILKPGGKLLSLSSGPNARFAKRSADLPTSKKLLFSLLGLPFDGLAKWHKKNYDFLYVQPNGQQLTAFTQYLEKTNIKPVIDSEYTFDQVNAAIAKIATGHSQGKVLLKVEDGGKRIMATNYSYVKAPNLSIKTADGTVYAYRELGEKTGIPVIFFTHLSANLDNWDPRVVDGIAKKHWVIAFDNKGVGLSSGKVPDTIEQMARDALTFIHTLGFEQIDILSFSMGGMIAQEILAIEPRLVRKLVLSGTGPRGGKGIENVTKISDLDLIRAILTLRDIKTYLFFTRTDNGKQKAKEFLVRIKERKEARDKMISIKGYRKQLKAIHEWGMAKPADLSKITQPTLVVNGDDDRMVPTPNSYDLAQRIPNSKLIIYKDSGHGGIFQNHDEFVKSVIAFLDK